MDLGKLGGVMWPLLQQAAKHGQPTLEKVVARVNSRVADVRMTGEAAGGLVRVTSAWTSEAVLARFTSHACISQ